MNVSKQLAAHPRLFDKIKKTLRKNLSGDFPLKPDQSFRCRVSDLNFTGLNSQFPKLFTDTKCFLLSFTKHIQVKRRFFYNIVNSNTSGVLFMNNKNHTQVYLIHFKLGFKWKIL